MISEDSDSSIERFLAEEGFCGDETPCDFVDNLPPCLRDNPDYPGIKPPRETRGNHQTPLLLKRLLHLVISVDCG
jgi:hypothetical protein